MGFNCSFWVKTINKKSIPHKHFYVNYFFIFFLQTQKIGKLLKLKKFP
ncbi:hypothetical protein OMAG_002375 [Candidatus Omnitrophus magneticus]|uniref:Uncharacterized protein n=1 Tax=Candidatus Omnitrophus magneticus TaxID=1609969 RepID=A0A0F0CKD1_9BACT|nr:hypothetical protein OMAG_002375 [Candidatus Omnitrophus magneticus]